MHRRIAISLFVISMLFATPVKAPLPELPYGTTSAQAAVSKSFSAGAGGGGGNVSGAGNRLGTLLSGWAVPVLTVLAGCLLVGALASRSVGTSVGITLLGLIFLLAPQTVESFAKGIASTVF